MGVWLRLDTQILVMRNKFGKAKELASESRHKSVGLTF